MTSSMASTTVSGAFLRICMWLYGAVTNTETRLLLASALAAA
jgi:hypothetical protein